jgi:hypothetical protein
MVMKRRGLRLEHGSTPSLLAETAIRHAKLAAVVDRSRDLVWWGRQRRGSVAFRLRPIRGGVGLANGADLADLVISCISGASLCAECIAKKIDVPTGRVKLTLIRISQTLNVRSAGAVCGACRTATMVFRVS